MSSLQYTLLNTICIIQPDVWSPHLKILLRVSFKNITVVLCPAPVCNEKYAVLHSSFCSYIFPAWVIKFCSWNCKGLNQPIKCSKVLGHLQHLGVHIAFLQETHLKPADNVRLRKRWVGQLYHSSFPSKFRGLAVIIHKSINCWLCPSLDRSSTKNTALSNSAKTIQLFMAEFLLTDPWHFGIFIIQKGGCLHFFPHVHHTFTRIDYFSNDKQLIPSVLKCSNDPIVIIDHAPVQGTWHCPATVVIKYLFIIEWRFCHIYLFANWFFYWCK